MTNLILKNMKKGDKVYYARIFPNLGLFEVDDLKVRRVADTWFSATDKMTKKAFLFFQSQLNHDVFFDREDALNKVLTAEDEYYKNE